MPSFGVPSGRGPRRDVGNLGDFGEWVRPHWSSMTGLAWRLVPAADVEDVVQEALAAAWRLRGRFDPERGSARTWLLTLTADHASRVRRRSGRIPVPVDEIEAGGVLDPLTDLDLQAAIAALPARQRLAVELFYYLALSVSEAAEVMGCAPGTVKSTLSDARAHLRKTMEVGTRG